MVECSDTDDESLADIDAILACMKTVETTKMVTALTTYQASVYNLILHSCLLH